MKQGTLVPGPVILLIGSCLSLTGCFMTPETQNDFHAAYTQQAQSFQMQMAQPNVAVKPAFLQNEKVGEVRVHGASIPSYYCTISAPTGEGDLLDPGPAEWAYSDAATASGSGKIMAAAVNLGVDFHSKASILLWFQKPHLSFVAPGYHKELVSSLIGSSSCRPKITADVAGKQFDMIVGTITGTESWNWSSSSGGGATAAASIGPSAAAAVPSKLAPIIAAAGAGGGPHAPDPAPVIPAAGVSPTGPANVDLTATTGLTPLPAGATAGSTCTATPTNVAGTVVAVAFAADNCAAPVQLTDTDATVPRFYVVLPFTIQ